MTTDKDGAISFLNIEKTYPGDPPLVAVKPLTLTLPHGAFAALLGPSGSGKTTLLNIASGMDKPTRGEVRIGATNITALAPADLCRFRAKHVGFIFQNYNLFPSLNAVENVEFTALLRGESAKAARARALESLEKVGLLPFAKKFPNLLSGGQQQRVAVARALATDPEIIFADEPTANLDSENAYQLIDLFESLNKKFGVTFLFSTHDARLMERVKLPLHMQDGVVSGKDIEHIKEVFAQVTSSVERRI